MRTPDHEPASYYPIDDDGNRIEQFGPEHIVTTKYVRALVRKALDRPAEERAAFWKGRRSFVARRLYESGLDEEAVVRTLVALHERCRLEAITRRVLNQVEAAVAQSDAQADDDTPELGQ